MKVPQPKEDPLLQQQQQAAANNKLQATQQTSASDTQDALRYFGARNALAGRSGLTLGKV